MNGNGSQILNLVRTICLGIQENRFPRGSRLPAERELSKNLDVSRSTLREALRILEVIGITHTKRGGGSYVGKEIHLTPLLSLLSPFLFDWDGYEVELVELRILLELAAVEEAAKNINWETARYLREPVRRMKLAVEKDDPGLCAETDIEFHERIFRTAQKPVMHKAAELITLLLEVSTSGARTAVMQRAEDPEILYRQHDKVLEALVAGDAERARMAMRTHLESVLNIYRKGPNAPDSQ